MLREVSPGGFRHYWLRVIRRVEEDRGFADLEE